MIEVIAKYEAPKQRATIHYGYRILKSKADVGPDSGVYIYTVATYQPEIDSIGEAHLSSIIRTEDVTEAWEHFHAAIARNAAYSPSTWEV